MEGKNKIPSYIYVLSEFALESLRYFLEDPQRFLFIPVKSIKSEKPFYWIPYYYNVPETWLNLVSIVFGNEFKVHDEKADILDIFKDSADAIDKLKKIRELSKQAEDYIDQNPQELLMQYKAMIGFLLSLIIFRKPIFELIEKAKAGNDDCFFKLIQIDKTFVIESWAHERIRKAELQQEEKFFRKLSKALTKNPFQTKKRHIELAFIIYFFWEGYLKNLTYSEIFNVLEELNLYGQKYGIFDEQSLKRFILRLGLRKRVNKKGT